MEFQFTATITSSYLTPPDGPLAPIGSVLSGTFTYNLENAMQFGDTYQFVPGIEDLSVYTAEGFELSLNNRITNVYTSESYDAVTIQSFVSEDPNGWHIVLDFFASGWLEGSNALPDNYDATFTSAYVSIYFTDEGDWVQTIDATIDSVTPVASGTQAFAEVGTLTLNHELQTITLQQSYTNPVVIAYVATENGGQPVNVRVNEISGDTISLQLQEPNYLDGFHRLEEVNYLVIEAGTWVLPDGTLLEAGTFSSSMLTSSGFESVDFQGAFDDTPLVFSQVQTRNGGDFVTTRHQGATTDGFQIAMQEEEALNGGQHLTETLGWLAIEAGSGSSGGVSWHAGSLSNVTHLNTLFSLPGSLTGDANLIAALSSFVGPNTAWVRGDGGLATGFNLSVEEERSLDSETWHLPEMVDTFAFTGTGLLSGQEADLIL